MADLDPKLALVLLWHWSETSSPSVPEWVRRNPHWPNEDRESWRKARARLHAAALPLISQMEREIRDGR